MSLDVLVADLLVDELLQEDVLAGGDGLELIAEIVDEGGGEVWVGVVDLEVLGRVEAVLEGVGGGAGFAFGDLGPVDRCALARLAATWAGEDMGSFSLSILKITWEAKHCPT